MLRSTSPAAPRSAAGKPAPSSKLPLAEESERRGETYPLTGSEDSSALLIWLLARSGSGGRTRPLPVRVGVRQPRYWHACFFTPAPPNFGLSLQFGQRPQSARLQPSHAPHRSALSTLLARLLLDGLTATSSSGDTSAPTVSPRSHSSMATLNWCCAVSSTLGRAGSRFAAPPNKGVALGPAAPGSSPPEDWLSMTSSAAASDALSGLRSKELRHSPHSSGSGPSAGARAMDKTRAASATRMDG
mmetsp:Transcript_11302/g.37390  ORF Transcript_11302/g.37390 Transcript_11302/m.37390 type:complete len:244 (-) Transcript_11302:35-766(-)